MEGVLNKIISQIKKWWDSTPGYNRIIALSSIIFLLLIIGIIVYWGLKHEYKLLFANLNENSAAKIIKKLEEDKIPYRLGKDGKSVYVPEKLVLKERVKIAGSDLPIGRGVGFEIFDKNNFGMSDEERKINFLRALQTEIERTIDEIDEIEKSRVHIAIPEKKLFIDEQQPVKASVYLKLKIGGNLKKEQINGIQNLVASSVDGLVQENVSIISTDGRILTDYKDESNVSDKKVEITKRYEEYLRQKIQTLLDSVVGINNSTVRVSVQLTFDKIERARETYNPIQPGAIKEEMVLNESLDNNKDEIISSNATLPESKVLNKQKKAVKYEVGKEFEKIIITPGEIKNINVAILLNGKYEEKFINDIKSNISIALGLNPAKGDKIDVRAVEFKEVITKEEIEKIEKIAQRNFYINLAKEYIPYGLLVILSIIFLNKTSEIFHSLNHSTNTNKGNGADLNKKEYTPEELLILAKQNPKEAAKIIQSWIR